MSDTFTQFNSTISQHDSGALSDSAALTALESLDYSRLTYIEVNKLTAALDAPWIPRSFAVRVLKTWMRLQDRVLDEVRSYLFFTPELSGSDVKSYANSFGNPSEHRSSDFVVENVIGKLVADPRKPGATRGNPVALGLIAVDVTAKLSPSVSVNQLFDMRDDTFFQTISVPDASVIIELPPFMRVRPTAYTLWSISKCASKHESSAPRTWVLNGSNDLALPWTTLHRVSDPKQESGVAQLKEFNRSATFAVPECREFFHYFQFKVIDNHSNNQCIQLKRFDISGVVLIKD